MSDKVLLIDDSQDMHTLITVRLAKESVIMFHAHEGAEGIHSAQSIQPDLILLDIDMPGQDGFAVCQALKADSLTMNIPIIFLTGTSTTEEKIRGLELGATDYIVKPFDPAELRARVRACLRTKALLDLLSKKAMIDGLTGLWNRTYFDSRLSDELSMARRTGALLSCIMADIDKFKSLNDSYGHTFGDQALRAVSESLAATCREEDIVCRYGGEEFVILLPHTPVEGAADLAERARLAIEKIALEYHDNPVHLTCSFGVADLRGKVPPSIVELADSALYQAKSAGRNRVVRCAA